MLIRCSTFCFFFFQAEDGIRDKLVTGVQTCALPISIQYPVDQSVQPPSPGWTDWSTGYCIEVPLARKKLSAYLLLPVGAFTPTPSATLPLACVWGFNNQALPTRLMSPSPKAWASWRTGSARTADCVPSKTGTVKLRLNRSVAAYVTVTSAEWM